LDEELLGVGTSELVVTTGGFVEDEELLELVLDSEVGSAGREVDDGCEVESVDTASVFFASPPSTCLCWIPFTSRPATLTPEKVASATDAAESPRTRSSKALLSCIAIDGLRNERMFVGGRSEESEAREAVSSKEGPFNRRFALSPFVDCCAFPGDCPHQTNGFREEGDQPVRQVVTNTTK